jgi:HEAT repeat protein
MSQAAPRGVIERTRIAFERSLMRRHLQAVALGKDQTLAIDLEKSSGLDIGALVIEATARQRPGSLAAQRLAASFQRSGAADVLVDQMASSDANRRRRGAQLVGALGMEHAAALLSPLLSASETEVRDAAARALGRMGGTRCADLLLRAIRRRAPNRTLIVELARAAPDLFLETALCIPRQAGSRTAVAIAAGLRRRRAAVTPLLALLAAGSRGERAAACTALGWIGAATALPMVAESLRDPDWRVRMSAVKALARLHGVGYVVELDALRTDPNARVRRAVYFAMLRLPNRTRQSGDRAWR